MCLMKSAIGWGHYGIVHSLFVGVSGPGGWIPPSRHLYWPKGNTRDASCQPAASKPSRLVIRLRRIREPLRAAAAHQHRARKPGRAQLKAFDQLTCLLGMSDWLRLFGSVGSLASRPLPLYLFPFEMRVHQNLYTLLPCGWSNAQRLNFTVTCTTK